MDDQGQSGQYVCLSYCWGRTQFLKLTTKNLEVCKQGILVKTLPGCFQHAIEISRGLGIRYIWIDALCILQDDKKDWEIQGSNMADIYRNSFLVIAMSRTATPHQDCLAETTTITIDSIQARLVSHLNDTLDSFSPFPLAQRGWCFQERLLAPRVVHFGPHELAWECSTQAQCECGRDENRFKIPKSSFYANIIQMDQSSPTAGRVYFRNNTNGAFWRMIAAYYTNHKLTFDADRLPALSGIAMAIQPNRPGTYLAGLWSDTLVLDMLWGVKHLRPCSRLQRSPSWSWATINGSIWYPFNAYDSSQMRIYCQVEGFHCEPDGVSMTGRIRYGWVKLGAPVLECSHTKEGLISIIPGGVECANYSKSGHNKVELMLDDPSLSKQEFIFFMLRMATGLLLDLKDGEQHVREGILLVKATGDLESHFERIGIAETWINEVPLPWPSECQVITVI